MRCVSLFAVAVLAVVLAGSSFSPVAAFQGIRIEKVTTNGDTTTPFSFLASGPAFQLTGGGQPALFTLIPAGDYEFTEDVQSGWVLTNVECEGAFNVGSISTFTYIANGVIIHYVAEDSVTCTFTNSPEGAVGGVVVPTNSFALLWPWFAVIGLVGSIGTVVVIRKRRSRAS